MLADMERSDLQTWVGEGGDQARGSTRLNQGGAQGPSLDNGTMCLWGGQWSRTKQEGIVELECSKSQDLRMWGAGKSHQEEQWVQKRLMKEEGAGTGPRADGSGW